jgi:hypothetical protein
VSTGNAQRQLDSEAPLPLAAGRGQQSPDQQASDPVNEVVRSLELRSEQHQRCARARVLRTAGDGAAVAVILGQGPVFREDREAIETLKGSDRNLPIIYVARTTTPRRETAIRRLCIHYFLAEPVEKDELRLVLEMLVRSAGSSHAVTRSFERFFTR